MPRRSTSQLRSTAGTSLPSTILRSSALRVAEDNLKAGEATDSVKASMEGARQGFITVAVAMGVSEARPQQMADQFGLTSGTVDTLAQKVTGSCGQATSTSRPSTSRGHCGSRRVQAKLYLDPGP